MQLSPTKIHGSVALRNFIFAIDRYPPLRRLGFGLVTSRAPLGAPRSSWTRLPMQVFGRQLFASIGLPTCAAEVTKRYVCYSSVNWTAPKAARR